MRLRLAIFVLALLIGGSGILVASQVMQRPATAGNERVIPVEARRPLSDETTHNVGETCSFAPDILRFFLTESQIVVTNETGEIIAIADIRGTVERNGSGSLACAADFDIPVPDASFYTVALGDERITGFAADDFPIAPLHEVWINFR